MLPPHLQQGLRRSSVSAVSVTVSRTTTDSVICRTAAYTQARSFWGWKRPGDSESRADTSLHRVCRYRTLQTRAKLLDKLRRRGRWDWDVAQRPVFSSKHIRLASHIGRPKWKNSDDGQPTKRPGEAAEEDGFELSNREKEWKDQMEAMRKRIEQDPYEAIFGKRYEPFWSPLVPSWMREEMGLGRSAKQTKESSSVYPSIVKRPSPQVNAASEPVRPVERTQSEHSKKNPENEPDSPNGQLTNYSYTAKKKSPVESDPECPNGQLTNYSYTASTSWDSWTQKTRREEWDSLSGQTKRFEYDPISNRMVQITVEGPVEPTPTFNSSASNKTPVATPVPSPSDVSQAAEVPVKLFEPRSAIPVPTQTTEPTTAQQKTSVYFPSLLNTSISSKATRPSALTKLPAEKDIELLTADAVRASVGKDKHERDRADRTHGTLGLARAYRNGKPDPAKSEWDQAETRFMLERELGALRKKIERLYRGERGPSSTERQKEHDKLQARLSEVDRQLQALDAVKTRGQVLSTAGKTIPTPKSSSTYLQSSLDRMVSKEEPVAIELDDSAAHESTGDPINYKAVNVPKNWEKQTELLQANRVTRTRDTTEAAGVKIPWPKERWIDVMNSRKATYDAQKVAEHAARQTRDAEKNEKLTRANAMHEAEVQEQKSCMQRHENRDANGRQEEQNEITQSVQSPITKVSSQTERERFQMKIADLRRELDNTFRQSSANAEMQVERIQQLEKELENAQASNSSTSELGKQRYVQKVKALREELDVAFKQSAVQGEKHVERIRALEKELEETRGQISIAGMATEAVRAEGDFCANVTKYANNNEKWYKQPLHQTKMSEELTAAELEKAAQKTRDRALVEEVTNIYESRYGTIDVNHRQGRSNPKHMTPREEPQVVEVETDVDLGKALADYEKEQTYRYQKDNIEAEIAAQEKEYHEFQGRRVSESSIKTRPTTTAELALDSDVHGARIVDETVPRLIPTEIAGRSSGETVESTMQWEEPPVYKVLAYDSGNDMFSTATTSSNFTSRETPISIPEALSQLYQPARFVPHFAELQTGGYQVIYANKDLLVFKKVKVNASSLEDHGLVKAAPSVQPPVNGANPIDGTAHVSEPNLGGTGFVEKDWDTITSSEGRPQSPSTISRPLPEAAKTSPDLTSPRECYSQPADEADVEIKHYPRVKREERVFSGGRLQKHAKKFAKRHHHEPSPQQVMEWRRKWKGHRSRIRWALSVGLGASVLAYGVGAMAEKHEKKERWQHIVEGRKSR